MVATVAGIHLGIDTHANRPAANSVPDGSIYSCSTHSLVYKSDYAGNSWATWATLSSGLSDPMTTRGDIIVRNASNVTDRLAVGATPGYVLTSDGTDAAWAAPSGGSTDPTIPSGGTLYDGSSTSGWTSFGSPDTFDANSTAPGCFYLSKTTMGTNNLVGVYRSVGSFAKTYTMRLADARLFRQYQSAGIVFGEAGGAGKFHSWGPVRDPGALGGVPFLQRYAWTSPSSSSSNTDYGNNTNGSDGGKNVPIWLRLIIASSTDVTFQVSLGGFAYETIAASVNPGFTIGVFGFHMYTFTAVLMSMAVDWIHES